MVSGGGQNANFFPIVTKNSKTQQNAKCAHTTIRTTMNDYKQLRTMKEYERLQLNTKVTSRTTKMTTKKIMTTTMLMTTTKHNDDD